MQTGKDLKLNRLLTDTEIDSMQLLLSGNLLRPGERALLLVLLDLTFRTQEQIELLKLIAEQLKPAVVNVQDAVKTAVRRAPLESK